MSKFFVGQPVRLVRYPRIKGNQTNPVPIGAEGRIVAFHDVPAGTVARNGVVITEHSDCIVDYGPSYGERSSSTSRIEPIQPSGHRSGDYSYTELMDRLKAGEVECV